MKYEYYCCCLVAKSCLTLCNPMDYSLPCSSVHGISQARILEWVAISSSSGSSQPRDRTHISCLAGKFFTTESPQKPMSVITHSRIFFFFKLYIIVLVLPNKRILYILFMVFPKPSNKSLLKFYF